MKDQAEHQAVLCRCKCCSCAVYMQNRSGYYEKMRWVKAEDCVKISKTKWMYKKQKNGSVKRKVGLVR